MRRGLKRTGATEHGECFRRFRVSRRSGRAALVVACVLASVAVALACGWSGPPESVRFGWHGSDTSAYTRLPPITLDGGARPGEVAASDDEPVYDYRAWQKKERDAASALAEAMDANALSDRDAISRARSRLRDLLEGPEESDEAYFGDLLDQQQRNTARDLLDAFAALDAGSPPEHLRAYAKARAAYDALVASAAPTPYQYVLAPTPTPRSEADIAAERAALSDAARRAIDEIPAERNLADNADYLRAAILYHESKYEDAARAFESVAARHPRSEKRDAALLMAGLAHTKFSRSYAADDESATASAPCVDCRDEAWRAARSAFKQLLADYPRGRFRLEARGRLAYLNLRVGDTSAGLAEYYRMLADESDASARAEALVSLRLARRRLDSESMRQVEAELADEPRPALVYAYHSIYNYAQNFDTFNLPAALEEEEDDGGNEPEYGTPAYVAREREREKKLDDFKRAEVRRVADSAAAMLRRYPRTAVGAEFALRLAEANFELNDPRAAREFAARALAGGLRGERRAEGLWISGVSDYRLKNFDAARRTLLTLVRENPRGRLEPGARRLVAMIAEDAGDLDGALEQYLALGYTEDAAYFLDVLMTPAQLAAFISRHPAHEKIDQLNYALGLRHLRDGSHAEARAAFARVRTSRGGRSYSWHTAGNCDGDIFEDDDKGPCVSPKLSFAAGETGVDVRWLMRDLQTINNLDAFDRAYESAATDEARAEALYQKASYIYESDLLFYNPAWGGERYYLLSSLDMGHSYRAAGEPQLLFAYMQRHDMAARALSLYLEVVRRYPQTRAARDALYTAAVCHDRLAEYNTYWRDKYAAGLHAGERLVTYADVRATYPDYPLPVGTFGWEPSTRTVNGHAAWPPPPKPPPPRPRLTRAQRVKRLFVARWPAFYASVSYGAARVWHWLTVSLVLAACLLAARAASRSRGQWSAHLARTGAECKPLNESLRDWLREVRAGRREAEAADAAARPDAATAATAPWLRCEPAQSWIETRAHKVFHGAEIISRKVFRRAELISRATGRSLWHYVSPLMHDTRGRRTLLQSAATHAALFALLLALVRMIYAG